MQEINDFALTFNGYNAWLDKETFEKIVQTPRHDTVAELRTCLFHAQREAHWYVDYTDQGLRPGTGAEDQEPGG